MPFSTALEPESLVGHFLAHPPQDFTAQRSASGMPVFQARFDLLTTMDDALRRRIAALPLYRRWGRLLRWRTRFAGCTVTEYTPLPSHAAPAALADELLAAYGRECALLIVKDLPQESPLLDVDANAQARAFAAQISPRRAEFLGLFSTIPGLDARNQARAAAFIQGFFADVDSGKIFKSCVG